MNHTLPILAVLTALMTSAAAANSRGRHPLENIQHVAAAHVHKLLPAHSGTYHVKAGSLDPRLQLAPCGVKLDAFLTSSAISGSRTTTGVRCKQPAWTVYLPVTVESEMQVLVLRHGAARDTQLSPADVEQQTRRVPGIATRYVADIASLEGKRLRRSLPAGSPLTADVLIQEMAVRRGQRVILLASNDNFQIRAQGTALSDGRPDERIRVQNDSSNKVVEGVVASNGVVRVGP